MQMIMKHFFNTGVTVNWEAHEKIPATSIRTLLTRFVDITSPPSTELLRVLANYCTEKKDCADLLHLANVSECNETRNIQGILE